MEIKNPFSVYSAILIICVYLCCTSAIANQNLPAITKNEVAHLAKLEIQPQKGDDCIVHFLIDPHGTKFVIKQLKTGNKEEQLALIREYVSAYIASQADIPIPRTFLIPIEWQHTAKIYPDRIAIVQKMAPGKQIIGDAVDIHQQSRNPYIEEEMNQRYGTLNLEDRGLTRKIINSMSTNPDLIKLVAFDTFVSNADRSQANLFYDEKTNHYYGIDHLSAMTNSQLSLHALRQIKTYKNELTDSEKLALREYNRKLKHLAQLFPPDIIIECLEKAMQTYLPRYMQNAAIKDSLSGRRYVIRTNYEATKKLIAYLDSEGF